MHLFVDSIKQGVALQCTSICFDFPGILPFPGASSLFLLNNYSCPCGPGGIGTHTAHPHSRTLGQEVEGVGTQACTVPSPTWDLWVEM